MKLKWKSIFMFGVAVARVVRDKLTGRDILATPELANSRIAICERCPYLDQEIRQCSECTCFVDVKTQLRSESCPHDKWR